jgi:hypothetical protein
MKLATVGTFVAALLMSSVVLAAGGGDRTFARMMAAKDQAMEKYVAKEQARDPVALNEKVLNEKADDKTEDL